LSKNFESVVFVLSHPEATFSLLTTGSALLAVGGRFYAPPFPFV
jgi:hypothetical protein